MGAGQSTADRKPSRGLHILRVTPSSPASLTDLESFFDFVVGLEGNPFTSDIDATQLEKIVESNENKPLNLLVWSSKTEQTRLVTVTPSREWSSQDNNAALTSQPSLLGLSMRLCEPEIALDNVWHVLDVLEGSPAEMAGLVPYGDWIVGWSGGPLHAEGDFYDVVEAHVDKPLRVYVYSYDFDTLREVVLVPNREWGGEGLLGCVFGFGLIHRIPISEPGHNTEDLVAAHEVEEYEDQSLFVPADTHADTVFDVDALMSSQPEEPPTPRVTTPHNEETPEPSLEINGSHFRNHSPLPPRGASLRHTDRQEDGSEGDDEDEDGGSLEDNTGSITSVD